jgi:hypothetical protein
MSSAAEREGNFAYAESRFCTETALNSRLPVIGPSFGEDRAHVGFIHRDQKAAQVDIVPRIARLRELVLADCGPNDPVI